MEFFFKERTLCWRFHWLLYSSPDCSPLNALPDPCVSVLWTSANILILCCYYISPIKTCAQSMGSLAVGRGQKLELWMSGLDKAVVAYRECWQILPCTRTYNNNNSAWPRRSTNKRIERPSIQFRSICQFRYIQHWTGEIMSHRMNEWRWYHKSKWWRQRPRSS